MSDRIILLSSDQTFHRLSFSAMFSTFPSSSCRTERKNCNSDIELHSGTSIVLRRSVVFGNSRDYTTSLRASPRYVAFDSKMWKPKWNFNDKRVDSWSINVRHSRFILWRENIVMHNGFVVTPFQTPDFSDWSSRISNASLESRMLHHFTIKLS